VRTKAEIEGLLASCRELCEWRGRELQTLKDRWAEVEGVAWKLLNGITPLEPDRQVLLERLYLLLKYKVRNGR